MHDCERDRQIAHRAETRAALGKSKSTDAIGVSVSPLHHARRIAPSKFSLHAWRK